MAAITGMKELMQPTSNAMVFSVGHGVLTAVLGFYKKGTSTVGLYILFQAKPSEVCLFFVCCLFMCWCVAKLLKWCAVENGMGRHRIARALLTLH